MSDGVGLLVREWRLRRRLSQQALSERCGVSTRHLSFLETGRAQPSRDMIRTLGEALEVPLREQRQLFLAAGFVPDLTEQPLTGPAMADLHAALEAILAGHEPFPALVVDRGWNLVAANEATYRFLDGLVDPALLQPPVNVVLLSLHPDGLGRRILDLPRWRRHLLQRLRSQFAATADPQLQTLIQAVEQAVPAGPSTPAPSSPLEHLVMPVQFDLAGRVLSLFTTTTVFGMPRDVTVSELAIEAFYPADDATREYLFHAARSR